MYFRRGRYGPVGDKDGWFFDLESDAPDGSTPADKSFGLGWQSWWGLSGSFDWGDKHQWEFGFHPWRGGPRNAMAWSWSSTQRVVVKGPFYVTNGAWPRLPLSQRYIDMRDRARKTLAEANKEIEIDD